MAVSAKDVIAKNIAPLLKEGDVVNLGVGLPTLIVKYVGEPGDPDAIEHSGILFHCEAGLLGCGKQILDGTGDPDIIDAGAVPVTMVPGACTMDSATSFAMARGGHLDYTILGAFQVDTNGDLANWLIPGTVGSGMGGAMDLSIGAKCVIVATTHTAKDGSPKLLQKCDWPLTALGVVKMVVTELAMMRVEDGAFHVFKMYPGVTREEILAKTAGKVVFDDKIEDMIV